MDEDEDGVSNEEEYIANTDMNDSGDYPQLASPMLRSAGVVVQVSTKANRLYDIWYNDQGLVTPTWILVPDATIEGTGSIVNWVDDGSRTSPAPFDPSIQNRFYRSKVRLPE